MNNAKFIKLISLVAAIILVMGVLFTGCQPENDPPASGDPTEAPSDTAPASEKPTEEPTEEPTVAPTEIPSTEVITSEPVQTGEYRADRIQAGQTLVCDLDFNGVDDKVSLYTDPDISNDFRYSIRLAITLNGETYSYFIVSEAYELDAAVIDCDPTDNRLEVVVSYTCESEDYSTDAFRVNADGTIEKFFSGARTLRGDLETWFVEGKLKGFIWTQIFCVQSLFAEYTITENGFEQVSETLTYSDDRNYINVINDMPISIINADGTTTDATLEAGQTIRAIETDGKTYVRIVTSDGDEAFVYISFTEDSYFPYIGDKEQHYYLEIIYEG